MKRYILFNLTGLLFAATLLYGCTPEETREVGRSDNPKGQPLQVRVTDAGMLSAEGLNTRAVDSDLHTVFTPGDRIGFYAVDQSSTSRGENLPLTLDAQGQWRFPPGQELYYDDSFTIRYYAYYPYQPDMAVEVDQIGSGDLAFFAPLIDNWIPVEDQTLYADYTASDLMTGSGIVNNAPVPGASATLTFQLTHRMALLITKFPDVTYSTTPDGEVSYNTSAHYILPFTYTSNRKGYQSEAGNYRYLGNPPTTLPLTGDISDLGSFNLPFSTIGRGKYHLADYTLSPTPPVLARSLEIGDFYMDDGTVVPHDVFILPPGCIAIVLKVGRTTNDNWADNSVYMQKNTTTPMPNVHAYALAVDDLKLLTSWMKWDMGHVGTEQDQAKDFLGYEQTKKVEEYLKNNGYDVADVYSLYYATIYPEDHFPAPAHSSGWFMPSIGQYQYWIENSDALLPSFRKEKGDQQFNWSENYWSSTENSGSPTREAWYVDMKLKRVVVSNKDFWAGVTSIVVF